MSRSSERKIRFISLAEAIAHHDVSNQKGTYRFGTDSIVFTPAKESSSSINKIVKKRTFDPGMDDPKFDRGFHPGYRR